MIPFAKCPACGSEMASKKVEKLLQGGNNTALVEVQADVCRKCGERLYSEETARRFDSIRDKLKRQETQEFELVGQSFKVKA